MSTDPLEDSTTPDAPEREKKPRGGAEDPAARKLRLEAEARALQTSISDGIFSDVKSRVAWILNLYPHTRNSDVSLTLKYWELFQPELYQPIAHSARSLFRLERETTVVRVRAKIQNEYNLFPADDGIRRRRRTLEEDAKEAAVEDKPARNLALVYADETGKTQDFVCVASVWVLSGYALFKLSDLIRTWQQVSRWAGRELHFTDLGKLDGSDLSEYIDLIVNNREFLSFKVIAVERAKLKRPVDKIVRALHRYMLVNGAAHEISTHRLKLPHAIRLTVDAEQSLDVIACADIQGQAAQAFKSAYGDELTIEEVSAISSRESQFVQLADIIAGAVNRRKNNRGHRGYKDDMADMIIERLGIKLESEDLPGIDATAWLSV